MEINKDIIVIRELLGLSQQELAKKLNTSFETINRWENNKVFPEDKKIEQIYSDSLKFFVFFVLFLILIF